MQFTRRVKGGVVNIFLLVPRDKGIEEYADERINADMALYCKTYMSEEFLYVLLEQTTRPVTHKMEVRASFLMEPPEKCQTFPTPRGSRGLEGTVIVKPL